MKQYKKTSALPENENVMMRPRVDALLEEGLSFPAVLVPAASGFGKTYAVAGFLERSSYRAVWQQLTLLDNLPMRFWESFVYTISLHRPVMAEKLKELTFPDSLYKFQRFLQIFTEELYKDEQFVAFVFDDFHLIHEKTVLRFFEYFLSANLENICVFFLTRKKELPSLEGKLYFLTAEDLRFTKEEAKEYFSKQNVKLSGEKELSEVYSYTKGWPVALYLVGRQIARKETYEGQHRIDSQNILFALLEKEIFSQYTKAEKEFFVLLSLLHFFPKEFVTRHMQMKNAGELLRDNIFVSFDSKAKNYYIHQLFLDFLEEKQQEVSPLLQKDILHKAGDWSRENRFFVDAIEYYAKCGAENEIVQVLQGFEGMLHPRNEADWFIRYIEKLSDSFLKENIMCRIVYAMLFFNNLENEKAKTQMDMVQRDIREKSDTSEKKLLLGEAYIAEGLISLAMGTSDFVKFFSEADSLLPDGSTHWGKHLQMVGYNNALNISSPKEGSADEYLENIKKAMPCFSHLLHNIAYGVEYLVEAEYHFLKGDLRAAEMSAFQSLYKAQEKNQKDIMDNARFLLVRIFLLSGKVKNISDMVKEIQSSKEQYLSEARSVPDVALGWFFSEIGEMEQTEAWILSDDENAQSPLSINKDMLLKIRCLIDGKEFHRALALTNHLEAILLKRNVLTSLLYLFSYRAVICYELEDYGGAEKALVSVYQIANGNSFSIQLVEFGHKTRPMLHYFKKRGITGIPSDWLEQIHAKASTYAKRRAYICSHFSQKKNETRTDYGLTNREIELLRNMSQGLKREEIAESMYISPHTVKSMLKTVYSKIGAVNGADAIRIASRAELIV